MTSWNDIAHAVEDRAAGRCEYCRMHQSLQGVRFTSSMSFRAVLAERQSWRISRGPAQAAICTSPIASSRAPGTQEAVPLFNPRIDQWNEHFRLGRVLRHRANSGLAKRRSMRSCSIWIAGSRFAKPRHCLVFFHRATSIGFLAAVRSPHATIGVRPGGAGDWQFFVGRVRGIERSRVTERSHKGTSSGWSV